MIVYSRGQVRLQCEGFFRSEQSRRDTARPATLQEPPAEGLVFVRYGNEQPVIQLQSRAGDPAEDRVLLHTFNSGFLIVDRIPGPAVQLPVMSSCCSRCQLAPFHQDGVESPKGKIVQDRGPGSSPADDDDPKPICEAFFWCMHGSAV